MIIPSFSVFLILSRCSESAHRNSAGRIREPGTNSFRDVRLRHRRLATSHSLIAPALYTSLETLFEGWRFFQAPHHIAFWIVAILLGLTQQVRLGIGVFAGPVVEGLLGSEDVKAYDVIGDTVNTAKRLCDSAGPGEILVSAELIENGDADEVHSEHRQIAVKGKRDPLSVCVLGAASAP